MNLKIEISIKDKINKNYDAGLKWIIGKDHNLVRKIAEIIKHFYLTPYREILSYEFYVSDQEDFREFGPLILFHDSRYIHMINENDYNYLVKIWISQYSTYWGKTLSLSYEEHMIKSIIK